MGRRAVQWWAVGVALVSGAAGLGGSRALEIRILERDEGLREVHAAPPSAVRPAALSPADLAVPSPLHPGAPSPADPTAHAAADPTDPLPWRLVDAGAVGIDPDPAPWGSSYSHGTGAFHALIDPRSSRVDQEALEAIRLDWITHARRMAEYGNNALTVGAFLELITFDGAGPGPGGGSTDGVPGVPAPVSGGAVPGAANPVYGADPLFPARHRALREAFRELFHVAGQEGLGIFLKTDMLALTPPLEEALRARTGGDLDAGNPALWELYARGLDELFRELPEVDGVVVRIGEAGALYNREGWPYASRMAVREPEELRVMLDALLPVFEAHGRTLVLRSWTVGLRGLGHLHTDPEVYRRTLGDIHSASLVVSTKYTRGDYFGFLPLNPTLGVAGHRRLIEFQARREFEGFTAFPNFLGAEHGEALRVLLRANPDIVGIHLWSQEGGPLHAGPRSLYPLHGFWSWIDANVHATSRLALDPSLEPRELAEGWVRERISTDPVVVAALSDLLLRSRRAVEKGLYLRPFAERDVRAVGVEVPPMMWIMEWDVIGDWRAVSSTVYRASRGRIDATVAEGFEAVEEVRAMRGLLASVAPRLAGHAALPAMERSLEYQESLFTALAWYRATLLPRYRWLDTGDPEARAAWEASQVHFRAATLDHQLRFGGDLDFPAYDFTPALAALDRAPANLRARDGSRLLLGLWLAALLTGGLLGRRRSGGLAEAGNVAAARGIPHGRRGRALATGALLLTAGVTAWFLMALQGSAGALVLVLLLGVFTAGLRLSGPAGGEPGPQVLWPGLVAVLPFLALMAVRGPDRLWLLFWSGGFTRALLLGLPLAAVLGILLVAVVAGLRRGRGGWRGAAPVSAALGLVLLLLSWALPDLSGLLATLDEPLSMLPMRLALIVAVTNYAAIPEWVTLLPGLMGAFLLAAGLVLRRGGSHHGCRCGSDVREATPG